jgi:hypothetical protein
MNPANPTKRKRKRKSILFTGDTLLQVYDKFVQLTFWSTLRFGVVSHFIPKPHSNQNAMDEDVILQTKIMRNSLLALILLFPLVTSADVNSCLSTKYENYSQARSTYQEKLTKLVISKHPEFASIARTLMNDQLIRIEKKLLYFKYLQKNDPGSLHTDKTISRWVSISNDTEQEIAANNHRYAEILNEVETSKQRPKSPVGDDLRELMREEIMLSSEFSTITSEFSSTVKKLNEMPCQ